MGVKKKTKNQIISRPKLRLSSKLGACAATNQGSTADSHNLAERIWQTVAMIPKGQVATYGQIARLIGFPAHSRYVGSTLANLPKNTKLPWFRVVNSSLKISQRGGGELRQRKLLEAEDITFVGQRIAKHHHWETGDT